MQPYALSTHRVYTRTAWTRAGGYQPVQVYPGQQTTLFLQCESRRGNHISPTPFAFRKGEYGHLSGFSRLSESSWSITLEGYGCDGDLLTVSNGCFALALDPYNKCLGKLYDQIRSGVDLSIDLYQGNQTVKMIRDFANLLRHPVDTLTTALKQHIVRRNWRGPTKLVGGKWLEWQYGLRPTVNTIYDLVDELRGALVSPEGLHLVKDRASMHAQDTRILRASPWHATVPAKVNSADSRRCQIAISYTIGDVERNALSQFTSLNPVSFFYENIPFSFVLDWMYDVGGYLRMMETALATGLIFHSGYVTETRLRTTSVVIDGTVKDYSTYVTAALKGNAFEKTLNRRLLTSMPIPRIPQVDVRLGSERLLSAASLLTNLLTQPSKRR